MTQDLRQKDLPLLKHFVKHIMKLWRDETYIWIQDQESRFERPRNRSRWSWIDTIGFVAIL